MKQFSSTVALLLGLIYSSFSQISSDCTPDMNLKFAYEKDVKNLALKRILESNSPAADEIVISEIWQDSIWEGLAAIYNVSGLPERDEVFDQHCIHLTNANYFQTYPAILIGIDPTISWASNWVNLETETGDVALDELLATYVFEITSFLSFANAARLETSQTLNLAPLFEMLSEFEGIEYAEPDYLIGGANRIVYEYQNGIKYFDFYLEWGDCFAGCINSKIWKFAVYPDCSVELLDVVENIFINDPIPEPVNCNLTDAVSEVETFQLEVFPNPVNDVLQIRSEKGAGYKIVDSHGQIVATNRLHIGLNNVPFDAFSAGVYVVVLFEDGQKFLGTRRVVKF